MQHAITIEWMVALNGFEQWILGISDIDTAQVVRDLADNIHIPGIVFLTLRLPDTRPIGVVVMFWQIGIKCLQQ